MRVSATFERDLERTYNGVITLSQFITAHKGVLRAIAKHALRYKTQWFLSDEDDMFQEACYWLVRAMWDFDDTRGRTLCDYVLYNIGVRLNTHIRAERTARKHPDKNTSFKIDIWGPLNKSDENEFKVLVENVLPSPCADPETTLAIKQAFANAEKKLTKIAKELLIALIEENGNMAATSRRLLRRKHIRKRFGNDPKHLEYILKRRVMPEISSNFDLMAIIPTGTNRMSNG